MKKTIIFRTGNSVVVDETPQHGMDSRCNRCNECLGCSEEKDLSCCDPNGHIWMLPWEWLEESYKDLLRDSISRVHDLLEEESKVLFTINHCRECGMPGMVLIGERDGLYQVCCPNFQHTKGPLSPILDIAVIGWNQLQGNDYG